MQFNLVPGNTIESPNDLPCVVTLIEGNLVCPVMADIFSGESFVILRSKEGRGAFCLAKDAKIGDCIRRLGHPDAVVVSVATESCPTVAVYAEVLDRNNMPGWKKGPGRFTPLISPEQRQFFPMFSRGAIIGVMSTLFIREPSQGNYKAGDTIKQEGLNDLVVICPATDISPVFAIDVRILDESNRQGWTHGA